MKIQFISFLTGVAIAASFYLATGLMKRGQNSSVLMKYVPVLASNAVSATSLFGSTRDGIKMAKDTRLAKEIDGRLQRIKEEYNAQMEKLDREASKDRYCIYRKHLQEYGSALSPQCQRRLAVLEQRNAKFWSDISAPPNDSWLDKKVGWALPTIRSICLTQDEKLSNMAPHKAFDLTLKTFKIKAVDVAISSGKTESYNSCVSAWY